MSDFLAIDLELHRICGVEATVERGSVKLRKSFSLAVPESISVDDPQGLGEWLKGELRRHRTSAGQVCISLPREDVIVRHLEVPDVSDDELPDLVRYQSAAKSSIPLDQLTLDFLPLPRRPDSAVRDVLVSSVHHDRIKRLRIIASAAGLELRSVGVSSVSTAAIVALEEQRIEQRVGEMAVAIAQHGDRVEISILSDGHLHFTHSTQVATGDSQLTPIVAEISRALVALQKRLPDARVVRCWMVGSPDENVKLGDAIHSRFRCEIKHLDPYRAQGVTLDCKPVDEPHGAQGVGPAPRNPRGPRRRPGPEHRKAEEDQEDAAGAQRRPRRPISPIMLIITSPAQPSIAATLEASATSIAGTGKATALRQARGPRTSWAKRRVWAPMGRVSVPAHSTTSSSWSCIDKVRTSSPVSWAVQVPSPARRSGRRPSSLNTTVFWAPSQVVCTVGWAVLGKASAASSTCTVWAPWAGRWRAASSRRGEMVGLGETPSVSVAGVKNRRGWT